MAHTVRQFTPFTIAATGSFPILSNAIKKCDDAANMIVVMASSATGNYVVQVALFDPDIPLSQNSVSTNFFPLIPNNVTTSVAGSTGGLQLTPGTAVTINNIAFTQLRIVSSNATDTGGTVVGWATKQISV